MDGILLFLVTTLLNLGSIGQIKLEIIAFNISSNSSSVSNSNSSAEVPVPRFTNGHSVYSGKYFQFNFLQK